jgi:outer membrane protein
MKGAMRSGLRSLSGLLLVTAMLSHPVLAAENLISVYHRALDNDPTFASARYTLEATKQKLPQAVSALLPSVALTGSTQRTLGATQYTATEPVDRGFNSSAWALQLTQPVLRMQNLYSYQQSQQQVDQASAQFEQAQQDLIIRVAQAYFDVLLSQDAIVVAQSQQQAAAEQQTVAQHGFDDGTTSITDVDEARARAELARAQLAAARNDLEAKQAELQKIIGDEEAPPALAPLETVLVLPRPDPAEVQPWVDRARDNNPVVRAARAVHNAAAIDIKKARALYLPTVDLTASYGGNYSSGNITNPTDYTTRDNYKQIGLQLNLPILDGGGIHSQNVEARLREQKAQADWDVARRQAATDARQAYTAVLSELSQVDALEAAVASTTNAVRGNRAGYQAGLRINSEVLNAVQQLGSAQQDLAKARVELLMQGLKLKAAAGILTEADLAAINRMLEMPTDKLAFAGP